MRKKIVAILAAVGLFSSGVFAAGPLQQISVYFDVVQKIVIFGQDKTPTDVKPFIYNNTTYVPLRYISEQLKVPVSWDASTGTVYLGETAVPVDQGAVSLVQQPLSSTYQTYLYRINNSLEPAFNVDRDGSFSFPQTFVMRLMQDPNKFQATAYESGISLKAYEGGSALYYDLGRKYRTLNGIIGFDSELNNKVYKDMTVKIIGDGETFKEITLSSTKLFEEVHLDVSGVKTLTVDIAYNGTDEYEPIINLVNMILE